jgi:hypothetical protein
MYTRESDSESKRLQTSLDSAMYTILETFSFRVVNVICNRSDSNDESNIQFKGKTGILKRNLKAKKKSE